MTTAEWMIVSLTIGGAVMAFSAMLAEWGKKNSARLRNGEEMMKRFNPRRSVLLDRAELPLVVDGLEALGSTDALKLADVYRAKLTEVSDPQ